jgi:hypothetical protein
MKTLGIFVGSDRFPEYFRALAMAAGNKGLNVHLHFFGPGVRLVPGIKFDQLPESSQVTICRESAAKLELDAGPDARWRRWLVPPEQMARIIRVCDRHLFI